MVIQKNSINTTKKQHKSTINYSCLSPSDAMIASLLWDRNPFRNSYDWGCTEYSTHGHRTHGELYFKIGLTLSIMQEIVSM